MTATEPLPGDTPVLGNVEPRIWTPPLRELTPETTYGYDVIEFADEVLHHPLDEWQRWLVIHACELLPDGKPRFRKVLVLVSRQNGKTEVCVVLSLYWQFVVGVPMILGTSTKLDYATEPWRKSIDLAESVPELDAYRPKKWVVTGAGLQESRTIDGSRYKIAAANRNTGRSLTVHRLILDELRQHQHYDAWDAGINAGNAVLDFQCWALTNAGDDRSVVLNDLRESAIYQIETGQGDHRLGIFEWSCEPDDDPLDLHALAKANPNLGRRIDPDTLLAEAKAAVAKGGDKLTGFKTEVMCIRVPKLDPAIDGSEWRRCERVVDLRTVRDRVVLCLDVAPDLTHATLVAAARLDDDVVALDVVEAWDGKGCTEKVRRQLPALLARIKPRAFGWFPSGPAAALTAKLASPKVKQAGANAWPPPGIEVAEIRGETAAVCMGFAEQVTAGGVAQPDDPLLNAHVTGAERLKRGDVWVFSRKGDGHCDAAYAAAGAVHLARTLPRSPGKPRLVVAE